MAGRLGKIIATRTRHSPGQILRQLMAAHELATLRIGGLLHVQKL